MIIKEGFDSKEVSIRISPSSTSNRTAEFWIEQKGLENLKESQRYETLSYATLDELLDLQDELKTVIAELIK